MSKEINTYMANSLEFNLIPKDKVSLIKIKLGKSHRKESDWEVIKEILSGYNLIVCEPKSPDRHLKTVEHILVEDGILVIFTNVEDCETHIKNLNLKDGRPDRLFQLGVMPFDQAVAVSDTYGMDLYIDLQAKVNTMCMAYVHGEGKIKAVMMAKY